MANKMAALFAILLVAAHVAAAMRTTITTVETEENYTSQQCQEDMRRSNLQHCMEYLQEQEGSYGGVRPGGPHFNECCAELRKMRRDQCRCEGLQRQMEQTMSPTQHETMQDMMRVAKYLPHTCGVGPQMCYFHSPYF